MSILIVSGCPGSGKTTVSAMLSARADNGVHLVTDRFYGWLARPIDPTLPASRAQNETVAGAFARAARSFHQGGYDVIVDGPWMLPVVEAALGPAAAGTGYVVLRPRLADAVARASGRPDTPAEPHVVEAMFAQFSDLGSHERHALEVGGASPDELVARIVADPTRWQLGAPARD